MKILVFFILLALCVADLDINGLRKFSKEFLSTVEVEEGDALVKCLSNDTVKSWDNIYERLEKVDWKDLDFIVYAAAMDASGALEIFGDVIRCSKSPTIIVKKISQMGELLKNQKNLKDKVEENKEEIIKLIKSQISHNNNEKVEDAGISLGNFIKLLFY